MNPAIIQIEQLSFEYPGLRALDNITLQIQEGTVTALVGPNGAGKTTLLRCIAGLDVPLAGQIRVAGIDVAEHPRKVHALMGYLSDFFGVYAELSVAQCLQYAAASQGLAQAQIEPAVQEVARQLGLSDKLGAQARTLSRGQRQRVAIGQAIVHKPKVLLLDEPASGLDPEARGSLASLFRSLQARGMTLIVSSHILAELDEYSTHMLALRSGRILEHRALHSPVAQVSSSVTARRLLLTLASPHDGLSAYLKSQAQLKLLASSSTQATFELNADNNAQAALLTGLVNEGFAVLSLEQVKENLQDSYLRSVQAAELRSQA
jgi:ABC-2 type transport system ATP-binding protein